MLIKLGGGVEHGDDEKSYYLARDDLASVSFIKS